jgi:hypothetical protein
LLFRNKLAHGDRDLRRHPFLGDCVRASLCTFLVGRLKIKTAKLALFPQIRTTANEDQYKMIVAVF